MAFLFYSERNFYHCCRELNTLLQEYMNLVGEEKESGEKTWQSLEKRRKRWGDTLLSFIEHTFILPWDKEDVLGLLQILRELAMGSRLVLWHFSSTWALTEEQNELWNQIKADLQDIFLQIDTLSQNQSQIRMLGERVQMLRIQLQIRFGCEALLYPLVLFVDHLQRLAVKYV